MKLAGQMLGMSTYTVRPPFVSHTERHGPKRKSRADGLVHSEGPKEFSYTTTLPVCLLRCHFQVELRWN